MRIEVDTYNSRMMIQFDARGGHGGTAKEARVLADHLHHLRTLEVPVTTTQLDDEATRIEALMDAVCKGIEIVYATASTDFDQPAQEPLPLGPPDDGLLDEEIVTNTLDLARASG